MDYPEFKQMGTIEGWITTGILAVFILGPVVLVGIGLLRLFVL